MVARHFFFGLERAHPCALLFISPVPFKTIVHSVVRFYYRAMNANHTSSSSTRFSIYVLIAAAVVCVGLIGGCRQKSAPIDVDSLPELPEDVAATLDPKTMATKTPASSNAPVKSPDVAFAPCCSSTHTRTMQVSFSYTKCVPLRIAFAGPFPQLILANPGGAGPTPSGGTPSPSPSPSSVKVFKLTSFKAKALSEKLLCTTSQGPWNATFIEERHCSPVTPQDTLIINAFSDQVFIQWSGGTPNHPPSVQVVTCRDIGETQANCGISNCACQNSSCPETQPCPCVLEGWFP